jgi:NhaP-type Na+/H+ or K+/H+ antiporter
MPQGSGECTYCCPQAAAPASATSQPPSAALHRYHHQPSSYLLPPIIFSCGLSVERHRFFLNLPSILLFGVAGTLMSFVIVGVFLYLFLGFTMFKLQVGTEAGGDG